MYLLYLDDSGSPENLTQENFVLGGFCIHEEGLYWLNRHLENLAESLDSTHPQHVEFHASEIFRGKKAPWASKVKDERITIIKDVLDVTNKNDKHITTFACAIHKPSFPKENPVKMAFEDLAQRFQLFLNRKYAESGRKDKHQGLIVLDESSYENSLQTLATEFRNNGTRWGNLGNIHEVPLFVDSKASRGIQLADHIAYSVFRRYEAADLNYFNVIQGRFDADNGKIHGLAHKHSCGLCTCPSCLKPRP